MKEAPATHGQEVAGLSGVNNPVAALVSVRLIDTNERLAMEADMLERLMGTELAALFRNDR